MMLDYKDIRIDVYRNSSPEIGMRLTHIPTGENVSGRGIMQFKLRKQLEKELEEKLRR